MKIILLALILRFIQIIDSKKYRVIMSDVILDYDIDKSVDHYSTYMLHSNAWVEEVDDQTVIAGGYLVCKKSMDPNLPITLSVRTQYFEQSTWKEGSVKLVQLDLCKDFLLPERYWYNITKLWTSDVSPPQKGDKLVITNQTVSVIMNLPPSVPSGPWRGYFLITQGLPRFETVKIGFGMQFEGVPI